MDLKPEEITNKCNVPEVHLEKPVCFFAPAQSLIINVLGLRWLPSIYCFTCKISLHNYTSDFIPTTSIRTRLSTISRIFYPWGILSLSCYVIWWNSNTCAIRSKLVLFLALLWFFKIACTFIEARQCATSVAERRPQCNKASQFKNHLKALPYSTNELLTECSR